MTDQGGIQPKESSSGSTHSPRWSDLSADPNDRSVIAARAATLRAAWRPRVRDRAAFLEERCSGRLVLDIGCVAHDTGRMESDQWLHRRLARAARRCVGVDVIEHGVASMRDAGYEVVLHDLSTGTGPLASIGPFDRIVAGELIEHVEDLGMLFVTAGALLAEDGQLIITTPNPYAPSRVWAGQRGHVWENVDHILYAFPSGIAELAERHGLELTEAMTTDPRPRRPIRRRVRETWRRVVHARAEVTGAPTNDAGASAAVGPHPLRLLFDDFRAKSKPFLGETFVYVVRRPTTDSSARGV